MKLKDLVYLICVTLVCVVSVVTGDIQNDPKYPIEYLTDGDSVNTNCYPFPENGSGSNWFERVRDLSLPENKLYGYIKVTPHGVYRGKMNCAIKLLAPEGYKLIVRVPRIEIYHDDTGCDYDFMSVIGATDSLHYCGFGAVGHSIGSTQNWLIVRIKTSEWSANHDYMGFSLYYTALHNKGSCNKHGENATEWKCRTGYCIPDEVVCDDRDNCGNWDDERVRVCGLSKGGKIAISVVCVLIGGTILFFIGYCIYSRQKEKRIRQRRRREVSPTMSVGYNNSSGRNVTVVPSSNGTPTANGQAEPPPPYTPVAYINIGVFTGDENDPNATQGQYQGQNGLNENGTDTAQNGIPPVPTANLNVRLTNASGLRPAMGEPPPLYTARADDGANGATGNGNGGQEKTTGVSFDPLPEKPNE